MPIRPERRHLYPKNWPAISELIRAEAEDRCQACGVDNGAVGYRDRLGAFVGVAAIDRPTVLAVLRAVRGEGARLSRIVLTVHHRDGNPQNNLRANLVALCQRCHFQADRELRMAGRREDGCWECRVEITTGATCFRSNTIEPHLFCSRRCLKAWMKRTSPVLVEADTPPRNGVCNE